MIFLVENVLLNFFLFGQPVCVQCKDYCFDSGVIWDTHVSSPVTVWLNCLLLPCDSASEMSKRVQYAVFCAPLWASWAPIVHTLSYNPNDYWQCHGVESLKSEESAGTDQKLRNVCRHALFRWPYAPNHHSPKIDAHFAPHRANSNDTIGVRTRDLPACSAVPQPTDIILIYRS